MIDYILPKLRFSLKTNSKYIIAIGAIVACIGSVSIAQIAQNGDQKPNPKAAAIANAVAAPSLPKLEGGKEGLASATNTGLANSVDALPSIGASQGADNPTVALPAVDEAAARAGLAAGTSANAEGKIADAIAQWSKAYSMAPSTDEGRKIARDAAKRLGFAAVENRNARMAESYWAAEAILARKLYFSGAINARAFSESLSHWASGAGAMGRSAESSAFVFYAAEVRARAQAAQSSQILNRESSFKADKVENIRVDAGGLCVTDNVDILKAHVTCDDERTMRSDAVSLQTRQITADAPPPPTKAEREAAEAKKKKGGEE